MFTAPIGSSAEGASFLDVFREEDVKEEWVKTIKEDNEKLRDLLLSIKKWGSKYNFAYSAYMAIRLLEMRRVLKDTGSIYLHCDSTMSHYIKMILDCVFGEKNFRNEITWRRHSGGKGSHHAPKSWGRNTDVIFFYSKTNDFTILPYKEITEEEIPNKFPYVDDKGERYYDDSAHIFCTPGMNDSPSLCYEWRSFRNPHSSGWRLRKERLEEEYQKGNIVIKENGKLERRKYQKDYKGEPLDNLWQDLIFESEEERTGYPTQKPLELLERIISASSKKGDIVLDSFCGCATTCVAAEKLGRKWIGIDVSVKAYEIVKKRLVKEIADPEHLFDSQNDIHFSTDPPRRTDKGATEVEKKYVYVISNTAYPSEYKVGVAKDWQARLNSYQTSDPNRGYKLEYKLQTQYFREIETHIHDTFENKHEWVRAKLEEIKSKICSYHKQLEQEIACDK